MMINGDLWNSVLGYVGYYEVSTDGSVRSLPRLITDSIGRTRRVRGLTLTPILLDGGYLRVSLSLFGRVSARSVHTLVLEAFFGSCPPGMEGCHGDGDPGNNHVSNLYWGTRSDNAHDRVRHGNDRNAKKDQCRLTHALVVPNLVPSALSKGIRSCRACGRAFSSRQAARRRGEECDFESAAHAHYARIMVGYREAV